MSETPKDDGPNIPPLGGGFRTQRLLGFFDSGQSSPEQDEVFQAGRRIFEQLQTTQSELLQANIGKWIAICTESGGYAIAENSLASCDALDKILAQQGLTRDPHKIYSTQITQ